MSRADLNGRGTGGDEHLTGLRGEYRDVLVHPSGRVVLDRGWRCNAIADTCRRLLASFLRGAPSSTGLLGLQVGAGLGQWDITGPPQASSAQAGLVDPHPFTVPVADLRLDFLDGGTVTDAPTNRLQVQADLGPDVPPWPDVHHMSGNLREFGLVAELGDARVLINYVTHPVIAKDPASTLQRTIWLTL
ncbi:hypothetical protein ACI780_06840 [Geodermatophilus sp. SYSU D00814]